MRRKVYGESRIDSCPFCGKRAVAKTEQGVPCCIEHKKAEMPNMKCACGDYLDVTEGKYGAYFRCMNCGNKSWSKGLEMNSLSNGSIVPSNEQDLAKASSQKQSQPKEIVVTSDEVDFITEIYR